MRIIDELYIKMPFYGSRKMMRALRRKGHKVNRKKVQRLMRLMGIEAIYPKPNTSRPTKGHKVYPYLLKNLTIDHPNHVWCSDITYIPMKNGFAYLTVIMDWYSRKVISWRLSNSLESNFCVDALEDALRKGKPEIFNTDQGSQYTSKIFTDVLKSSNIQISMDGKGRAIDNIVVERFWRSIKYEKIYTGEYRSMLEVKQAIREYIDLYNSERLHETLDYYTPNEVYEREAA